MKYNKSVINWDEISRRLTGDPSKNLDWEEIAARKIYASLAYFKILKHL